MDIENGISEKQVKNVSADQTACGKLAEQRGRTRAFIIRAVIAIMLCVICFEWIMKRQFDASLRNFRIGTDRRIVAKGFQDGRLLATGIPVEDLDDYIVGYSWRQNEIEEIKGFEIDGKQFVDRRRYISLRWPSLLVYYKVRLRVDYRHRIPSFEVVSRNE